MKKEFLVLSSMILATTLFSFTSDFRKEENLGIDLGSKKSVTNFNRLAELKSGWLVPEDNNWPGGTGGKKDQQLLSSQNIEAKLSKVLEKY